MGRATPYEKQAGDRAYESVYGRPPHAQVAVVDTGWRTHP